LILLASWLPVFARSLLGARASCSPSLASPPDGPDGGHGYPGKQVRRPWRWRASASKMLALPGGVALPGGSALPGKDNPSHSAGAPEWHGNFVMGRSQKGGTPLTPGSRNRLR